MPQHTTPTIVGTRIWDGSHDPGLSTWLGPHTHHYDGEQLVIDTIDGPVQPWPGYSLALWTDGEVTVASPRTAERVYGPDGLHGQLARTQAAVDRVRRLSEMTVSASCRVQAIDQARDTLAELDGTATGEAHPVQPPRPVPFVALLHGRLLAVLDDHVTCPCCCTAAVADKLLAAVLPYTDTHLRQQLDDAHRRYDALDATAFAMEPALVKFTAVHVTPQMKRQATERARQTAADNERATEWFAEHSSPHPGRPAAPILAEQIAAAIEHTLLPVMRDREVRQETSRRAANNVLPVIGPATRTMDGPSPNSEAVVQRVTALYEQWVKAGPPRLGTSISRGWDRRLAELRQALLGDHGADPGVAPFIDRPFRSHRQPEGHS